MDRRRRAFLHLAGAAAVSASVPPAWAQAGTSHAYPARPVRLIVGFPAGGPNDILGRIVAQWLSWRLGQPFVAENRPGNAGNIATAEVVRAPADGYTLLLVGPANAIGASLYPDLPFNFLRDIAPVAGITREPLVMLVHPAVRAKSVPELIALAKTDPRKVKMASTGQGSAPHVSGELFKMMTGLDLAVVHYAGGGPALKAMIDGDAELMFEPMSAAIAPVRAGQLTALAVTTVAPSAALPNIPTVGEFVLGYEASAATGIGAPKGTPTEVVDALNQVVNAGFADAEMKARLADTGGDALPGSPAEFGRLLAEETTKWAKVVKFAGPGR